MKKINRIFTAIACAAALTFGAACTNLDETVYSSLTDENLSGSEDEINDMMGNLYVQLRYCYWAWEGYFDINEESSDCLMTPYRTYGGWGAQYINLHQHDFYAGIPHLWQEWNYCYNGIMKANQLLETDVIKNDVETYNEVRAIRCLNYFILFDLWRNIPLETNYEQTLEAGYLPVQTAPENVWDFLVSEIEDIIPNMSTKKVYGRMNKYAACMLAAKIFLNHDAWLRGFEIGASPNLITSEYAQADRNSSSDFFQYNKDNDNKWYKKAFDYANIVTSEGGYSLAENYLDISRNTLDDCSEVIFVLPLDGSKASHNYLINKCFVGKGGKAFGYDGTPWNGSCAVPQFVESYDADDTRRDDTWAIGQQYYYETDFPIYEADGKRTDSEGALTAAEIAADERHTQYGNVAGSYPLVYTVQVHSINNPGAFDFEGARFKKQEIVPGNRGTYGDDVCFYRLADAMFIKAEAILRIGGSYGGASESDAATWVTQIRQRAFRDTDPSKATRTVADLKGDSVYDYGVRENTKADSENPYADFTLDANGKPTPSSFTTYTKDNSSTIELGGLLDDLGWEFVGEHHRRQDLIRFMTSDGRNVYNGKTWFCHKNKAEVGDWHNNVFPIYSEFVQSNVKLIQNYGFSDESSE